jgi:hypothetical protein
VKQILVFIMLSSLLCWFMFAPIYKHIVIVRQAVLQKEVDLLLEVGTNGEHGYIDDTMVQESKQRLEERGFNPDDLIYTITTTSGISGTNPSAPVLRGTGVLLHISYPYERMLDIDRLVGIVPPAAGSRMSAAGMKMSEYVP